MKKKWRIIVGALVVIIGLGALSSDEGDSELSTDGEKEYIYEEAFLHHAIRSTTYYLVDYDEGTMISFSNDSDIIFYGKCTGTLSEGLYSLNENGEIIGDYFIRANASTIYYYDKKGEKDVWTYTPADTHNVEDGYYKKLEIIEEKKKNK